MANPWELSEPSPPIVVHDDEPTLLLGSSEDHHVAVTVFAPKEAMVTLLLSETSAPPELVVAGECVDEGQRVFSLVTLPRGLLVRHTVPIGKKDGNCRVILSATDALSLAHAQMIQWDLGELRAAIERDAVIAEQRRTAENAARTELLNARRVEAVQIAGHDHRRSGASPLARRLSRSTTEGVEEACWQMQRPFRRTFDEAI